jgi:hypothetical protein
MTQVEMPQRNGARTAKAMLASSLCVFATCGAYLCMAVGEILVMLRAVALNAKRDAVGDIKAQLGMFRPGLDVVGVDVSGGTATLACIAISLIHSLSPFCEFMSKASAWTAQRIAGFPGIGAWASLALSGAGARAKDLFSLICRKDCTTSRALLCIGQMAPRPALFRAILGCTSAVALDAECLPAYETRFGDRVRFAHSQIIAQQQNECKYVTLERLTGMGLEARLITNITEGVA